MSFKMQCPHCRIELEAEDEWIGMESECPECGKNITIARPEPPRIRSAIKMPSVSTPVSGSAPEEKECPFCGETIRYKAKVCRFCQRTLPGVPTFGPIADVPRGPYPGAPRGPYGNPPPQAPYGNPQGLYGNPYSATEAQDNDEVVGDLPPRAGIFSSHAPAGTPPAGAWRQELLRLRPSGGMRASRRPEDKPAGDSGTGSGIPPVNKSSAGTAPS